MPLGLGHQNGEGVNIDARIYIEVAGIYPPIIEVRSRKDVVKVLDPSRGEIVKIDENMDLCWTKRDEEGLHIAYNVEKQIPIVRVYYKIVDDPWRPAVKNDGIVYGDFDPSQAQREDADQPPILLVQKLNGEYGNLQVAYAWIEEPGLGHVAYYLMRVDTNYQLIARTCNGRILLPELTNNSKFGYANIEDAQSHLQSLAKLHEGFFKSFMFVPSRCPFIRKEYLTWKEIIDDAERFKRSQITSSDLERLIWNYKK